ncbi:stage V sporulation protein B [Clostridium collagenovorans DSM 3089]|uniref:Stage V sporulation protein B n=1 Tax=Clostridium collagenovorans DSM 3089 TaxID=1121306 RepID=A0A1M5TZK2_9CLOT|nr:polysaccharide biosynthesis protein [Clostridium collagenovorans]SHH56179.1 stage V sporulation protein B [Clostridium collagenovorans DSM 3089]
MNEEINLENSNTTKGFAILSISVLVAKVLSVVYTPMLLRILGEEGIGIYSSSYQIYVFIYMIATAGIPTAIAKCVSQSLAVGNPKDAIKSFKIARSLLFVIGLILSILMWIFAEELCMFIESPDAVIAVKALSPTIFITAILSTYRGYFQGRNNMTPSAISQVVEQVVNIPLSLIPAIVLSKYGLRWGVAGGTIGTTLGALCATLIMMRTYSKQKTIRISRGSKANIRSSSNKALLKKILAYTLPITICVCLQNLGLLLDPKVIKSQLALNYAIGDVEVYWGILYQFNTLINIPITIIMSLAIAILPVISGLVALEDKKKLKEKINYSFRICFLVAIPSVVGLMVLSSPICRFLGYSQGASKLLLYGSVILVLMCIMQLQTAILQGIDKLYLATGFAIVGIVTRLVVSYVLVAMPSVNILGAVAGIAAGVLVPVILSSISINGYLKGKVRYFKLLKKPLIASLLMGIVTYMSFYIVNFILGMISTGYIMNAISTLVAISIGGFSYIYTLILIGGFTKSDLSSFPSIVVRTMPNFMKKIMKP